MSSSLHALEVANVSREAVTVRIFGEEIVAYVQAISDGRARSKQRCGHSDTGCVVESEEHYLFAMRADFEVRCGLA